MNIPRGKHSIIEDGSGIVGISMLIYVLLNYSLSQLATYIKQYFQASAMVYTSTVIDINIYLITFIITIYLMRDTYSVNYPAITLKNLLLTLPIFFASFILTGYVNSFSIDFFSSIGIYGAASSHDVPKDTFSIFLFLLQYVLLPAVFEETLFRGVMLKRLVGYGAFKAIIMSSSIFALLHFSIPSLPVVFLMGVLFSYLTLRMKSLMPAMILHFLHNLTVTFLNEFRVYFSVEFVINIANYIAILGITSLSYFGFMFPVLFMQGTLGETLRVDPAAVLESSQDKGTKHIRISPFFTILILLVVIIILTLEFLPRILSKAV